MKAKENDLIEVTIREIGARETDKFLKELPEKIRNILESALVSLLGLEKRGWNDFEIDHCNGRNSILTEAIKDIALNELRAILGQKGKLAQYSPAIQQAVDKEIKSQIGWIVKKEVEAQIQPFIRDIVRTQMPQKVRDAMRIAVATGKVKPKEAEGMPF